MFPDGRNEGLYHTADATLWFFHAVIATCDTPTIARRCVTAARARRTSSSATSGHALRHRRRSERDGLLRQGAEGYQLTWMDAKVDGWVVTPRRGKAVEINALWYNALRLLQGWLEEVRGGDGRGTDPRIAPTAYSSHSMSASGCEERGYLATCRRRSRSTTELCRPNQIFAISLDNPCSMRRAGRSVLDVVGKRLLTPVGLRSLAPGEPEYKPRYFGDLRARDAAYHQGTVWAWLIGPLDRRLAQGAPGRPGRRAAFARRRDRRSSATSDSGRSARSSMPSRRSRPAAASRRPGAWRRLFAAG